MNVIITLLLLIAIVLLLIIIINQKNNMALDLTALTAEAARTATLEGKAATALTGATSQSEIDAITATLKEANDPLDAIINPPAPAAAAAP